MPARFGPLWRLQCKQEYARFGRAVRPPCCFGMICSISKVPGCSDSASWQYSQRKLARCEHARRAIHPSPLMCPRCRFKAPCGSLLQNCKQIADANVIVEFFGFRMRQLPFLVFCRQSVDASAFCPIRRIRAAESAELIRASNCPGAHPKCVRKSRLHCSGLKFGLEPWCRPR